MTNNNDEERQKLIHDLEIQKVIDDILKEYFYRSGIHKIKYIYNDEDEVKQYFSTLAKGRIEEAKKQKNEIIREHDIQKYGLLTTKYFLEEFKLQNRKEENKVFLFNEIEYHLQQLQKNHLYTYKSYTKYLEEKQNGASEEENNKNMLYHLHTFLIMKEKLLELDAYLYRYIRVHFDPSIFTAEQFAHFRYLENTTKLLTDLPPLSETVPEQKRNPIYKQKDEKLS